MTDHWPLVKQKQFLGGNDSNFSKQEMVEKRSARNDDSQENDWKLERQARKCDKRRSRKARNPYIVRYFFHLLYQILFTI